MKGYKDNIEAITTSNTNFRQVLYTGKYMQLVAMTLQPGEDIGPETHDDVDQFFRFESGQGAVRVDETEYQVKDGDVVIVPAGAQHNVQNTSEVPLTLYTIYTPPEHIDGTVHATKVDAIAAHEHFDGVTTE